MRKRTHEEYVEELKIKNPNLCVIGKYINSNTKIEHKCLIHNISWMTTPTRALMGAGCEKCHCEKITNSKTRSHEEYVEQVKQVNPDIIPMEEFKNCNIKMLHYCKRHDITWNALPNNILRGHGCSGCLKEKIGLKNSILFEKYQEELKSKFPTLECIGDYVNHTTPVLHRCKMCGYEWSTQPIYILSGCGCKKCNGTLRRNTEEYIEALQQINPQLELIGEFVDMKTHTLHRCKIHDYSWNVVPSSIIHGTGCPICGKEKIALARRKTHEDYEKELSIANPDVICIDRYTDSYTKIKVKCLKCNRTWTTLPFALLQGHGCPICNRSMGENTIEEWLIDHDIEFETQKRFKGCKDKKLLPFDFYLPSKNVAIEFDGEQHSRAIEWFGGKENLEYVIKHDEIKTNYCKDNNIKLLRITYKDDIKSKLNSFFI